jgi:hypothetical protein
MYRDRTPRHVEVDSSRRSGDRLPIVDARANFVFGEPAITDVEGRTVEGMIGWDPALGWVLNIRSDDPSQPDEEIK